VQITAAIETAVPVVGIEAPAITEPAISGAGDQNQTLAVKGCSRPGGGPSTEGGRSARSSCALGGGAEAIAPLGPALSQGTHQFHRWRGMKFLALKDAEVWLRVRASCQRLGRQRDIVLGVSGQSVFAACFHGMKQNRGEQENSLQEHRDWGHSIAKYAPENRR